MQTAIALFTLQQPTSVRGVPRELCLHHYCPSSPPQISKKVEQLPKLTCQMHPSPNSTLVALLKKKWENFMHQGQS